MTAPKRREYDQALSALRAAGSEKQFNQHWDAGRAMDMDQAIQYALEAGGTAL